MNLFIVNIPTDRRPFGKNWAMIAISFCIVPFKIDINISHERQEQWPEMPLNLAAFYFMV